MAHVQQSLSTRVFQTFDRHLATRVADGREVPDHVATVANNVGMVATSAMMVQLGLRLALPADPLPAGFRPETTGDKAFRMTNGAFLALLGAGLIVKDSTDVIAHVPGAVLQAARTGVAKLLE